ncbi:MAG TPA: hypothetical protein VMF08_22425 [Candidatus Sulfotelmatobacter sp.]|nr:hypothetical protein [Candidatus Sulfotelmatobacter sp.]
MLLISCLVLAAAARTRPLDWNVFSINQNPVPATAVVSFSIGYPKGWHAMQTGAWRQDIYYGLITPLPDPFICAISPPPVTFSPTNWTAFFIFPSWDKTAKDAAEGLAKSLSQRTNPPAALAPNSFSGSGLNVKLLPATTKPVFGMTSPYIVKGLTLITTAAGDSGWLVESEATTTAGKTIAHDYFFHSGKKGSIRINIVTPEWNQGLRSDLDKLVLQTLRF